MATHDIEAITRANDDFRRELETAAHSQLVVMTIPPGGEIGEEVHEGVDQLLVVVEGDAEAILDGEGAAVGPGQAVLVPGGTRHNVRNVGGSPLRLWTVYAPPEHASGTVHATKAEADAAEEHG